MSNQKVIGPLRRVAAVKRHGDHEDQAGVPGQKGGSAPGFTHVGATPEGTGKISSSGEGTTKAIESLKGLDLESSFSLVGSVAGKVIFEGPEGHTKVFDVETGQWEHSDENANALLQALEEAETPLIAILEGADAGPTPEEAAMLDLGETGLEDVSHVGTVGTMAVFVDTEGKTKIYDAETGLWDYSPYPAEEFIEINASLSDTLEGGPLTPGGMLFGGARKPAEDAIAGDPNFKKAYASLVALQNPEALDEYLPVAADEKFALFQTISGLHVLDQETGDWAQPGLWLDRHDETVDWDAEKDKLILNYSIEGDLSLLDTPTSAGETEGEAPLRSGNVSLVNYADTELPTKRMVNQIADAGFGLTGKDYPGTGDNAYIFNLMAQLNPAIRNEGYHVDDQLTVIHQSKLKIILDAIEYEAERASLPMGDDLAAVMALNATLEYPSIKDATGQEWNPDDSFILEGINEEFQRRMVMESWAETTIQGRSLKRGVAPGNITSPAEGRPLEESYGLDPGVIQTWTSVNNLSKETSEALYSNYLTRFSTPGTAENTYRFEGETPFDSLNNVIFSDKYSWVPRDEGPDLEQAASYMNRGWQITTSSPEAIVLTEVVANLHGGTPIPRSNFDEDQYRASADSLGPDAFRDIGFSNDTARIAMDIYARTQQQLADSGLKRTDTVRLYRGMDNSGEESVWNPENVSEGLAEFELYSLSSWTPSVRVARRFSDENGWLLAADVPVQRLWANADTGPPSKGEQEWMVLGINGIDGAILPVKRSKEIENASAFQFGQSMSDYFDGILGKTPRFREPEVTERAKLPVIKPDLTHMMWITTLIENETGLDSTKVPVKDVRDAEFVAEQDAKIMAETEEGLDDVIERHLAPIHPGTGTDQSVHAGDGGGGRQPGDDFPEVGITEDTWKRQPFDKDLAGAYADSIEDEFGRTPSDKTRNATWIAPDGRKLAEGSIHEDTSMHAVSAVSGIDTDDITIAETQVIQAGLIRHTSFTYGQDTFVVSGVDTLTRQQARAIRNMMHDRVDSRAGKQIQSDSDKYRVGLRLYVVEDIPATLDPISRNLEQISGRRAFRLLGLKRSEWRVSGEDSWGQLIVSTAPRRDWSGKLITESKSVQRHFAPIHPGTGTDQSVHAGGGAAGSVESYSEGPDDYDNYAGDYMTATFDRDSPDTLVKLLKYTPNTSLVEGEWVVTDDDSGGDWDVEIISGPNAGYTEGIADYELDPAPMGTADLWETDTSPSGTLARAEGIFGITDSMSEAGYILPSGELLDFSGGPGGEGQRGIDHRSISQALLEDEGGEEAKEYSGGMIYFMGHTGAIRTSYFGGRGVTFTLDIARQPTQAQWRTLLEWSEFTDELIVDISDPDTGARLWSNSSFNQSDPPATIRELREQAQELLDAPRVMRMTLRHYGPGPHPGTGTDQSIHAGGANGMGFYNWQDSTIERLPKTMGRTVPEGFDYQPGRWLGLHSEGAGDVFRELAITLDATRGPSVAYIQEKLWRMEDDLDSPRDNAYFLWGDLTPEDEATRRQMIELWKNPPASYPFELKLAQLLNLNVLGRNEGRIRSSIRDIRKLIGAESAVVPSEVRRAISDFMRTLRALPTKDLKTFIRTRWSDFSSHINSA